MLATQKEYVNVKSDTDIMSYERKSLILDKKIDQLIYQLYGLTEEEVRIVEGG
jgi:hypothetical protein